MDGEARVRTLTIEGLEALFQALEAEGRELLGPRRRDGVVGLGRLSSPLDLPAGWEDQQAPGRYRLRRREEGGVAPLFAHRVGAAGWRTFLRPSQTLLWRTERREGRLHVEGVVPKAPRRAFIGVRPCDLAAIAIQDRVLTGGRHQDLHYAARRRAVFLVAVECTRPAATCFCHGQESGPGVEHGFDLRLTELVEGSDHYFLAAAGSEAGRRLLRALPGRAARPSELDARRRALRQAARAMARSLPEGAAAVLARNLDHPHWSEVGRRCLACGNCTAVCPTCFCSRWVERTGLDGTRAEHWRVQDSCFDAEHSLLHGGPVRRDRGARYRQWLTHKLLHWEAQFGVTGCTGCGRCITWCPVGIDLTAEVKALAEAAA